MRLEVHAPLLRSALSATLTIVSRLSTGVRVFALAALVFVAMDAVWLTLTGERLYRHSIGHLMRPEFALLPAVAFYLLYIFGMVVFAIAPAANVRAAAGRGALFGLIAYATYDLTNQATLIGWPWQVTLADLCWGTFVTAVSCAIARRFAPSSEATAPPIRR